MSHSCRPLAQKHFDSFAALPYPTCMSTWTDETANWYAANYGEYPTNRLGVDAIDFAGVSTVVDVGCGTGAALRHLSSTHLDLQLIGVDPVGRMVEIARQRLTGPHASARIEFRIGPAESIPVDDDTADVVLAFDSFDHWHDHRLALDEIRRILLPTGRLVVLKDEGSPGGAKSRALLAETTSQAGFALHSNAKLNEGDVTCDISVYCLADPATADQNAPAAAG
jgi:SAM-dependent methyltransferase